jgi:hypothetical protein
MYGISFECPPWLLMPARAQGLHFPTILTHKLPEWLDFRSITYASAYWRIPPTSGNLTGKGLIG